MAWSWPTMRRRRAVSNSPASLLRRLGSSTVARFVLIKSLAPCYPGSVPFASRFLRLLPASCRILLAFFITRRQLLETTKTVILSCAADRTHPVGSVGNSKRLAMKSHRTQKQYLVSLAEVTDQDDRR